MLLEVPDTTSDNAERLQLALSYVTVTLVLLVREDYSLAYTSDCMFREEVEGGIDLVGREREKKERQRLKKTENKTEGRQSKSTSSKKHERL